MRDVLGLLSRDAPIRGLLIEPIPIRGFRFGRVHEVEPRDDLLPCVPGDDVEAVAIVPAVGFPAAVLDLLERLRRGVR